jgi:gas vesicle protein
MTGILLQAAPQINGMTDVVFGLKDVGIIVGGIIATLSAFLLLKGQVAGLEEKLQAQRTAFDKEIAKVENDIAAEKLTRHSNKKEYMIALKEKEETIHKRIDKTQEDFKKAQDKTQEEFNKINETISGVKSDTSEIKGMVQTLISNQKK